MAIWIATVAVMGYFFARSRKTEKENEAQGK